MSTPKADALFLPRDNPRALVIRPTEQWPLKSTFEKASQLKDTSTPINENGKSYYLELYNVLGVEKYRYQKNYVLVLRQIVPISKLFVITSMLFSVFYLNLIWETYYVMLVIIITFCCFISLCNFILGCPMTGFQLSDFIFPKMPLLELINFINSNFFPSVSTRP